MSLFSRSSIDNSVFFSTVCLLVVLNVSQYAFNLGEVASDRLSLTFGFPCSYYSESLLLNRGRVSYWGIIGDLMFALILGLLTGYLASRIRELVRKSRLD